MPYPRQTRSLLVVICLLVSTLANFHATCSRVVRSGVRGRDTAGLGGALPTSHRSLLNKNHHRGANRPFLQASKIEYMQDCIMPALLEQPDTTELGAVLLRIFLRMVVVRGHNGNASKPAKPTMLHVRGYVFMEDVSSEYFMFKKHPDQMVAAPALAKWGGGLFLSSRLTGSNYSLEVQGLDKGWRDAPLPFTGEIQMHDTDAHRFPLELFLSASNFDTLCSVVASPHTPNQLNPARSALPHSLPPKSEYRTTWVIPMKTDEFYDFSVILKRHADFHSAHYGVSHYLVYMMHSVGHLLEQPDMQNNVMFHAVLANWLTPTLLIMGDIDEFLYFAKPMTVGQMMETLTPPGKLVAAVGITCLSAVCDACEQAHPSSRELDSWTDDDVLKGGNPIDLYQFAGSTGNEIIKVIVDVNLISYIKVHSAAAWDGELMWLEGKSILIKHARNLWNFREHDNHAIKAE